MRWATAVAASRYMHCSRRKVGMLLASGALKGYRFGKRTVLVDLDECDAIIMAPANKVRPGDFSNCIPRGPRQTGAAKAAS